jgi:predicted RNA methylase
MFEAIILFGTLLILLIVSIAVPAAFVLEIVGWTWTGVPYVPLPTPALKRLRAVMGINDTSVVYDLGCGDGKVLFELARGSRATFIGVEKAPLPFLLASVRRLFSRQSNVQIVYGDIYKVSVHDATHVFTYLFAKVMDKLLPKFEAELRKGSTVVSCDFKFQNRMFNAEFPIESEPKHTLYLYRF